MEWMPRLLLLLLLLLLVDASRVESSRADVLSLSEDLAFIVACFHL